jgi:hypothetical protein
MGNDTKSASITPFSASVFYSFCRLPSALCPLEPYPSQKRVVNPDLVLAVDITYNF